MMDWEYGAEENDEEEEEAGCVEEACTWGGSASRGRGKSRVMSEDVDGGEGTIEMVVDSG